jgi:hypothetical protein
MMILNKEVHGLLRDIIRDYALILEENFKKLV